MLVLIPPARSYSMIDDWAYARSVQDILNGIFTPHEWVEANAFGHNLVGALFASLFGYSFTTLTAATLFMSAACISLLYLLLRQLDVAPALALWGSAVLALNPLYLHLSYSFMTDVTFFVYMLAALLCYVRGMKGYGAGWLWLGSIAASLAFLTRQFGLLLLIVALVYLWWSRNWTWRRALAIAAIPVAAMSIYLLWDQTLPTRLVAYTLEDSRRYSATDPMRYIMWRGQGLVWALTTVGMCLLPLAWLPRRPILTLPALGFVLFFQAKSMLVNGTISPQNGNILSHAGMLMYHYYAAPVWVEWVWLILGLLGGLLAALYVTSCLEQLWQWLREKPWRTRSEDPAAMLYLLGFMMVGILLVFTPSIFDRYWLALFPILIVAAARRRSQTHVEGRQSNLRWSWALLVPVALFAILAQRDYQAHATARWQGAEQLAAQGIPRRQIDAGYEWAGWYLFDEGAAHIRAEHKFVNITFPGYALLDPVYLVSDIEIPGYTQVNSLSYTSWLNGGQERNVLILKRE
ncbi:MAG TPA: glycosyltransferase family 39 protein [Chloroflexia bacterium]|nr:glycosyltransferase family 39 protein [Chloroflexia bacterium]